MKLYSDTLTMSDLYAALPDGVSAHITRKDSRKRAHAYDATLYLYEKDDLHRRYGNSGGYGSAEEVAATWDEWGVWIAALYEKDPEAIIGWYEGPEHFRRATAAERDRVRQFNKSGSLAVRTHTAPWLAAVTA